MDNRNFFRALFWGLLAFLVWTQVAQRIWPPPEPTVNPSATAPASAPDVGSSGLAVNPTVDPLSNTTDVSDTSDAPGTPSSGDAEVRQAAGIETVTLGQAPATEKKGLEPQNPYRMEVTFSNVGASVTSVTLSDHLQDANSPARYTLTTPYELDTKTARSFAVERVILNGSERISLGDARWAVRKESDDSGESAVFTTEVSRGGQPVLALERRFRLPQQSLTELRSDMAEAITLRNLTSAAQRVQLVELGAVGITREARFQQDQKVFVAVNEEGFNDLETKPFNEVSKKGDGGVDLFPREDNDPSPLSWYGVGNVYFTATQCPVDAEGNIDAKRMRAVRGIDIDGNSETENDVTVRTVTKPIQIEPGAAVTLHTAMYLGPKDRRAFEAEANSDYLARNYMLQIKEGYGSCTFNFLTDMMIGLLNWIERVTGNFGIAIIFLVIVVRALLHPITKKTQVNMMRVQQRMAKLHPKIEEIKKRCGNDSMKLNQETMKLYREEGVNPMTQGLSCLPMMLQMPIWIALYSSLRNNVAMRCEGFMLWINDLTAPDVLIAFSKPLQVPLVGWKIEAFHLLPLLVGVVMFAQQKLMPKPKSAVATDSPQAQQAEQMQKIMPYMSLVMIFIFYKFPSGLNLYIMTSSLIGALEQLYIRRHISQQDLSAPTTPSPASERGKRNGLLDWLQKKAEEAQKTTGQRPSDRKRR